MISQEQSDLAEQIKAVHLWIRKRTTEVGAERAWKEHLEKKEELVRYSQAMKQLAEVYWDRNNQGTRKGFCRISWIEKQIKRYFLEGVYEEEIRKETSKFSEQNYLISPGHYAFTDKLKLLDVGSCYNPFKKFELFETYAVDLCPASQDVMLCNFLEVQTKPIKEIEGPWYIKKVEFLPEEYFDVVVFCLFLEYLPSPEQRMRSCRIAWNILKLGGILLIVTPDSKHQSANAKLMKSWKIALAGLGFIRFAFEKLRYLCCMGFRKTGCPFYTCLQRYSTYHQETIAIPQDSVDYRTQCENLEADPCEQSCSVKKDEITNQFSDLPNAILD